MLKLRALLTIFFFFASADLISHDVLNSSANSPEMTPWHHQANQNAGEVLEKPQ